MTFVFYLHLKPSQGLSTNDNFVTLKGHSRLFYPSFIPLRLSQSAISSVPHPPSGMSPLAFLALLFLSPFFVEAALEQQQLSQKQCNYYQGSLGFCRDIEVANFTAILHSKKFSLDEQRAPQEAGQNQLPSWLQNFPLNFFGSLQPKNASWTLRLPIHARRVFLGRLRHFEFVEPVLMNETELKHRRVLEKPNSDATRTSNCDLEPTQASFVLLVNVTDLKIHDDAWYVICAEFNSAEDPQSNSTECTRCNLVKTMTQASPAPIQFLQYSWVKGQPGQPGKGAVLRYTVADMPFASALIHGTVVDLQKSNTTVFEFERTITPRQQIFIRVPEAEENGSYFVKTDLYPHTVNGTVVDLGHIKPLIFVDYLKEESN